MTALKGNTKVVLHGRDSLVLRPSDYVATGGEGSIYRAKNTVIKLYTDSNKMQREGMADKIKLLSEIKHKYIVSPTGLVTTPKGREIGFYMPFADGEPFPRIFTNDFRNRTGFTDNDASTLVARMQDAVHAAHDYHAIMVDANEFNWMARLHNKNRIEPRIIDVDSWAIGKWPATVVMLSIKDWHTKDFNELTDWFAWGIVSFQLYTGIHPYKGRLDGFTMGDLCGRMRANASVFHKGIRLNRAVRDFSSIPGPLLDWYVAVFEHGERMMPPSPLATGVAIAKIARVARVITTASGSVSYEKLFGDSIDQAIRVFPSGVVLLKSGRLVNLLNNREISVAQSNLCEVVRVSGGWLKVDWEKGNIIFSYLNEVSLTEEVLPLTTKSNILVRYENRIFVVTDNGLTEVKCTILGKPVVSFGQTWGAMRNATKWFDGLGIQDTMGATYLILPFGDNACAHVRVRELDGLHPVEAKAGHRFVTVIAADSQGDYHKLEFSFNRDYTTYTVWRGKTDTQNLNIAILPKGVCATVVTDGELMVFVPSSNTLNRVADRDITTDMVLAHWDNKVVYIRDGNVWHVRMK